ncbi:hypothetical protein H072_4560 [Dactylellina haptotyla CBS 200.50]|uniref:Uncharacterized protein n=1 Tax=Dactylellina haptotyla (strain CBS 200.50) TaxID=1284197 RepID=S8BQ25_DACHA|nr:hypothetical protein H072_4560 [Dactylellina haptotyla CBS 200.50]
MHPLTYPTRLHSSLSSQASSTSSQQSLNIIATQARIDSLRNLLENSYDAPGFSVLYQVIINDYISGRITYQEGRGYLYNRNGLIAGPLPEAELRGEAAKRTLSGNFDIHLEWCSEEPVAELINEYSTGV